MVSTRFITSDVLSIVFVLIITLQNSYWEHEFTRDVQLNKINHDSDFTPPFSISL